MMVGCALMTKVNIVQIGQSTVILAKNGKEESELYMEDAIRIIEGLDTSNSEENIEAKKMAVAAMMKQIPKKPVTYTGTNRADCPVCGETVRGIGKPYGKYCSCCGQKLDWSDDYDKRR